MSEPKPKPPGEISIAELLSTALAQSGDKEQVEKVTRGITGLTPDGLRELLKTEAFQQALERLGQIEAEKQGLPPGSVITVRQGAFTFAHKKSWTRGDVEKTYPAVTQTAWRSEKIMPHGIAYAVTQGQEYTLPSICWDLMRQTDDQLRRSRLWAQRHFGTPETMGASGFYGLIEEGKGYAPTDEDLTPEQIDQAAAPAG